MYRVISDQHRIIEATTTMAKQNSHTIVERSRWNGKKSKKLKSRFNDGKIVTCMYARAHVMFLSFHLLISRICSVLRAPPFSFSITHNIQSF